MRTLLTIVSLLIVSFTSAQLIVDDFTTGTLNRTVFNTGESDPMYQTGKEILGNSRHVYVKVNQNPFDQGVQLTIKDKQMSISAAYDTRGTIYVNYGHDKNGLAPLKQDLSKFKNLKIQFEGKSTINGLYVSLFTGTSRAVYSNHVPAKEGRFVVTIPLINIKKIGPSYSLSQIDYMRFQFDSRSKTGCNMAISKIWFD